MSGILFPRNPGDLVGDLYISGDTRWCLLVGSSRGKAAFPNEIPNTFQWADRGFWDTFTLGMFLRLMLMNQRGLWRLFVMLETASISHYSTESSFRSAQWLMNSGELCLLKSGELCLLKNALTTMVKNRG